MPIHLFAFQESSDFSKSNPVWIIDDSEIIHLSRVFEKHHDKTGYSIDEYNDTVLPKGNLRVLEETIVEVLKNDNNRHVQISLRKFLKLTQETVNNKEGFAFIGE